VPGEQAISELVMLITNSLSLCRVCRRMFHWQWRRWQFIDTL